MISKARKYAEEAHIAQTRVGSGEPYFNHCRRVAQAVEVSGGSEAMIAAAYLHDVVEDTEKHLMRFKICLEKK